MLLRSLLILTLFFSSTCLIGCGDGSGAQNIKVPESNALDQAKTLLQNYANGQPVASEATSYAYMVTEVRKTDAAKADILEKGFAEISAAPGSAKDKATEMLSKL